MFKTVEISRTWSVHQNKIPDLNGIDYVEQSIICLSSSNDSLQITINKEAHRNDNKYYISIIDMNNNKLSYLVTEEDFEQSKELIQKVLHKKVFLIKSSVEPDKTIQLSIYKDLKLFVANYYATNNVTVQTLPLEEWFNQEIEDLSMSDLELFNKLN